MFSSEWLGLISMVSEIQRTNSYTWFRGISDSDYKLSSGLYRNTLNQNQSYLGTEIAYYNFFKRMGHTLHYKNDWELLYIMQHYGVRTRLLDWSNSFSTALFFANKGWKYEKNCVIWILSPLDLNNKWFHEKIFYTPDNIYEQLLDQHNPGFFDNSVALFPFRNTKRIIAQQGVFTLQGKLGVPLDEEYNGELIDEGILRKINIPPRLKIDVDNFLRLSGINEFSMFPDLDGLAKYINGFGYFGARENLTEN